MINTQFAFQKILTAQGTPKNLNSKNLWATYRYSPYFSFSVLDNNIFSSATIIHNLNLVQHLFNKEEQKQYLLMKKKVLNEIAKYQNKNGQLSYNFWKTCPPEHFPYGRFLRHWNYLIPPDDADDSSLVGLISDFPKKKAHILINNISSFANNQTRTIKRVPKEFKKFDAFTTFMGEKTPLEFDVCVQSNVLSLFHHYQVDYNKPAKETIAYLQKIIQDEVILKKPFLASPNYYRPTVSYYHLARFFYGYRCKYFLDMRKILLQQIKRVPLLDSFDAFLQKLSFLLIGEESLHLPNFNPEQPSPFFIAGMLSGFANSLIQYFAKFPLFHISFYSPAINWSLLVQYLLLQKEYSNKKK